MREKKVEKTEEEKIEDKIDLLNMNWCKAEEIMQLSIEHNDTDIISTTWDLLYDLIFKRENSIENSIYFTPYWWQNDPEFKHKYTRSNKVKFLSELFSMLESFIPPAYIIANRKFPWVRYKDYKITLKVKVWIDMEREVSHILVIHKPNNWCTVAYIAYNHKVFSNTKFYQKRLAKLIK